MGDAQTLLHRRVDDGTIPGGIVLIGGADAEPVAVGMPVDAIVRIQSMTKAVTAVATLRLIEAGRLTLDAAVTEWLPELADRRVLVEPTADLDRTVAAERDITVRHLLTNTSGYGMIIAESPLQRAMSDNRTAAGPEPVTLGADEWLAALAMLPLAFQPGDGWRYHHSFGLLGILLSRLTGAPLGEHLAADLFGPLGMPDTGYWVPADRVDRLPPAWSGGDGGDLVETEPAAGGFYAGPPPFDVSHAELVSTAPDYHRFLRGLVAGELVSAEHLALMTSDQVPQRCKTADSFFPGFWDGSGWGFGVGVETTGDHVGRYGWAGGQGTDFFVDPDGTSAILLTQVAMGQRMWPLLEAFQQLTDGR